MASLSVSPQFETNAISNSKVIELLYQLKSAKAHGRCYIKVTPPLVRHLLRNRLLTRILSANTRRHFSLYSLLGYKFSTNLLFAVSNKLYSHYITKLRLGPM